jgi:hypothetical protein
MLLYTPPAVHLWRYAASIQQLQTGSGQQALESALRNQKSFWKYVGILSCVMMALYALGMLAVMGVGLIKR